MTTKTKRHLRCILTKDELLELGKVLAEHNGSLAALEADKARVVSDFKAKATALESEISICSNKISTGYEFRSVECTVIMNDPKAGKKMTYRDDTAERVSLEDMNPEEMQAVLPLEKADEK